MDSSPYREYPFENPALTEVLPDHRRRFMVISGTSSRTGDPWTLVLESQEDYWISRRELHGSFAPGAAVSGYLFDRQGHPDPVAILRRMNELIRGEYYRILQEKMKGDRERSELVSKVARLEAEVERLRRIPRAAAGERAGPRRRRSSPRSPGRRRTT